MFSKLLSASARSVHATNAAETTKCQVLLAFDRFLEKLRHTISVVSDETRSKREFSLDLRKTGPEHITTVPQWLADQRLAIDIEQVKCIDAHLHLYVTLTGILCRHALNLLAHGTGNLKSLCSNHVCAYLKMYHAMLTLLL